MEKQNPRILVSVYFLSTTVVQFCPNPSNCVLLNLLYVEYIFGTECTPPAFFTGSSKRHGREAGHVTLAVTVLGHNYRYILKETYDSLS